MPPARAVLKSVCSVRIVETAAHGCHTRPIARRRTPAHRGQNQRKSYERRFITELRTGRECHWPAPMTAFSQLNQADGKLVDFEPEAQPPAKRPSRWSIANWPVRWKVFAIVLVPLVLAGTFGGLRIYSSVTAAADLRRAADRAEMVPAIESYMASLDAAMLASSTGGDTQAALTKFDASRQELQRRLSDTDVAPDVSKGVNTMIGGGQ